jgi:hypothetical protein
MGTLLKIKFLKTFNYEYQLPHLNDQILRISQKTSLKYLPIFFQCIRSVQTILRLP